MLSHIKKLCESYIKETLNQGTKRADGVSIFTWPKLIYSEIKGLKTLDFEPDARYEFILIKEQFSRLARTGSVSSSDYPHFRKLSENLIRVLESYLIGVHKRAIKDFSFLQSPELKAIVVRDYRELHSILMPDGAWKSAVIMAGSILESILYDLLSSKSYVEVAELSPKAPKRRGLVIELSSGKWKLIDLINVSTDIGILSEQRSKSIDQVLRDYRNFVHPQKEIKSQHPCTEAEAYMAKGCLDGVYNHLVSIKS
ncbi:hypothetical protein B0W48_17130 [Pseudoalteromonas aliena]|uniref:DUF4145 domain-containing protein n=1 Tax=Pseudoalteromonas aliena TaxID=247523 RepID=A0A1Q2H1T3_9GAMM|nr:hypothetical protein [Pseudoalteromonas aliena]AQQ01339.1 hypothetical protein B0W48_17130 [Pseudoalteromonas aliena]